MKYRILAIAFMVSMASFCLRALTPPEEAIISEFNRRAEVARNDLDRVYVNPLARLVYQYRDEFILDLQAIIDEAVVLFNEDSELSPEMRDALIRFITFNATYLRNENTRYPRERAMNPDRIRRSLFPPINTVQLVSY